MPAIDKKESLRKLADIAEDMGFRVWFDFKQCHIHEMYGTKIVPVFDNDYEGAGAYADDLTKTSEENAPRTPSDNDDSSGQNNQNNPGGNNNNFFITNF